MPKPTFKGVRLQLIGDTSITVNYPDVHQLDVFLLMKEATDNVVNPKLEEKPSQKS